MANPEHLKILKNGSQAWNSWYENHPTEQLDLSGCDLSNADLRSLVAPGANLRKAGLNHAWLGRAVLRDADLREASMVHANLSMSDLRGARLSSANLESASLRLSQLDKAELKRTRLAYANVTHAVLGSADVSEAFIAETVFGDNDLSGVRGLDTVRHGGPSIIGIRTIYRSNAKIPEGFLRGAGIPEDFIAYMRSLVGKPIEFYSCFISYTTKDQEFADHLYNDLQSRSVRCWFASHDAQGGKKLYEQIDVAIRLHEKVLLILSPNSMNSEWVKTEIAKARKREVQEARRVLFPLRLCAYESLRDWVCFDADTGKDSAREICEYYIPDFSNWRDRNSYQEAFERLLRDLKAEKTQTS